METPLPSSASTLTPEQEARISVEAKSYQGEVGKAAWQGRSRGYWAGSAMGIFFGGLFGALAAFSTVFAGVGIGTALALVPPLAAAYAVAGLGAGILLCTEVGAAAGAVAGGLKEQDRRRIMADPSLAESLGKNPRNGNTRDFWKNPFGYFTRGTKKLFNWKVALFGAACGLALAGLFIFAGSPLLAMTGIGTLLANAGVATTAVAGATTAITISSCVLMGAFFGLDVPTISRNVMDFMGEILSGNIFERGKEKSPAPALQQAVSLPRSKQMESLAFHNPDVLQGAVRGPGKNMQRVIAEQQFKALTPNQTTLH